MSALRLRLTMSQNLTMKILMKVQKSRIDSHLESKTFILLKMSVLTLTKNKLRLMKKLALKLLQELIKLIKPRRKKERRRRRWLRQLRPHQ